jgi:YfiH family protein
MPHMRLFRILPSPNESFASIPLPSAPPGLRAGISLRAAGDLRLGAPAREPFFRALGSPPTRLYACRQVHSRRVLALRGCRPAKPAEAEEDPELIAEMEADGLASGRADCLLSVTVADCLPIFVYDRRGGAFALLHSGWQGTGIVTEGVRILAREYGAEPGSLVAVLGPGIGPCCYAVDGARAELFRRRFGGQSVRNAADGRTCLDLRAANAALLEAAGVREVYAAAECTACTDELFSFRRDGPAFWRMTAFIGAIRQ